VPFTDDQSDNAARIERAGAGKRLSLAAFRQEAAPRLKELMGSQPIAEACRSLATKMSVSSPLDEATRLIEDLVPGVRVG
jgi:UDP:flavonoid glycosyltransferase YjiC (YdhE family)